MSQREKVIINEVGLRDGLQNQARFVATPDKIRLAEALINAGVRAIEAASFVNPKAVPQMADGAEVTAALLAKPDLDLMALVPNLKGYELAKASRYRHIGLVIATTDTFNLRNIRMTREQAQANCLDLLARAKNDGIITRVYISGACACPYEGKIPVSTVHDLVHTLMAAGADEISIADTVGAGNPRQITDILRPLIQQYGASRFNLHLHDTRGQALAMAWAGVECGIRSFDASIGGLGGCPFAPGASGNVATEDMVYMLEESGFDTGVSLTGLCEAVSVAEDITGLKLGGRVVSWIRSQERRQCNGAPLVES